MQPDQPSTINHQPAVASIILAAGKSTRMRSAIPKPLHPVCGVPLTRHVVEACREAGIERSVVVIGHEADSVRAGLGDDLEFAIQEQQRGSGDAARAAESAIRGPGARYPTPDTILVLAGDVPLLRPETLRRMLNRHRESNAAATLLTAMLDDATGYGRVVRSSDGSVARIVEHKDATAEERAIREWNPSIYCFETGPLFEALARIQPDNVQGEYYLTDVIGMLSQEGGRVEAVPVDDSDEVLGVNTRVELARVAEIMQARILQRLMLSGVTVAHPASTYVDVNVTVGQDTVIEPNCHLLAGTVIGERCTIGPMTRIVNSHIGDGTAVLMSQVVDSEVGKGVKIGPFANLRPGCVLADHVKIGDFVELKNARLGEKVSASHLSYIGDTEVGAGTNIGAGVVTCNYDGVRKHRTKIGRNAFIGTHATLIAPIEIGDGAYVAAGSPIAEDVPADSLAIARSRPTIKPEWARRRREPKP